MTIAAEGIVAFDFAALSARERYKIMIGTVVPRPIALVTTLDEAGRVNAAPFSFFGCLSSDPAIVGLGVEYRPDGTRKDTGANIEARGEFAVNIVSGALLHPMNVCAVPFPAGVDEIAEAGLTLRPGHRIGVPSIAEAPASLECRLHSLLTIGESRQIVLGEIVGAQFHAGAIDERLHVDPQVLDALGRMGGHGYATTRDRFDLPTMDEAEHRQRNRRD
ncbi:flavin reductase family protein [Aurantimonas sp. Leaf443]|uniref:flavin reductase family protein n=1 Tax=Aurantimonas sp. Leaf443 TaxID=1736378 RepID=UPI0006FD7800|nr:flavin reductase family protein [Aurantimonas sp. Leaf443]KQT85257.1 flavin reductase [Aurantimonas sp. Leaf443]